MSILRAMFCSACQVGFSFMLAAFFFFSPGLACFFPALGLDARLLLYQAVWLYSYSRPRD